MEILIRLSLGFAGVLVHCLKNFDSLRKDAKAIKVQLSLRDYLEVDWLSISLSVIAVLVWPFLFEEAANKYAHLEGWVYTSFAAVGLLGSYIVQAFIGKGRSVIRSIAREQTESLENISKLVEDAPPEGDPVPGKGF